ncbi:MAG: HRDC domain-containing protein [Wenzhouxiangellaceae bacterium]|nr:HRDC domain-containing protein [Wenzhouxiangellaceae bacterium]
MLSEDNQVADAAGRILASPAVGIDTEFVRERTYYPIPGLVQLSDGDEVWLVDPIRLPRDGAARDLLARLLSMPECTKIMHSIGEDLEVLDLVSGSVPVPLFDTQLAAALLGWPLQVRYEFLARDLLGIEFPGGLARNDWRRRPLPEAWVEYAANDVIALPRMRAELAERLARAGRLDWLGEDCRRALAAAGDSPDPVLRIKGAPGLDDEALERLTRLARWREDEARKRDLPRGFIVPDPLLLDLARQRPADSRELERCCAGHKRSVKRFRDTLLALLAEPPGAFTRRPELDQIDPETRQRVRDLQDRVRQAAAELGIEPAVIASKRELTRLVQGAACSWLEGWRAEVLGTDFGA